MFDLGLTLFAAVERSPDASAITDGERRLGYAPGCDPAFAAAAHPERVCRRRNFADLSIELRLQVCIRSLSRIRALAPLALRRLRIVGGVGIVFGYSRDKPAGGERLQVRLQRVSNLLRIDLPVVHVERKRF